MPDNEAGKGGCMCGCSSGRCCGTKIVKFLIPLLLGGIVGYILGGQCAYKKAMCPVSGVATTTPITAPPVAK